jgi:hypothetical protein
MGIYGSKIKLPKEDMQFLMDNTSFTKKQIKAWYKGFMVSLSLKNLGNPPVVRSAETQIRSAYRAASVGKDLNRSVQFNQTTKL